MVTRFDISRHQVRELCRGNLIAMYQVIKAKGDKRINLNRKYAITYMVQAMSSAGFTIAQIAAALGISKSKAKGRLGRKIPKSFLEALDILGNPLAALIISEDRRWGITLRREYVEYLLIEDMAMAGWTVKQIEAATGFGKRRIQRIVKKVREEQE
jgi:hypothetical protein